MDLLAKAASLLRAFGAVPRVPGRPTVVILAVLGTLMGSSVALGAAGPSVTLTAGKIGLTNSPPSFSITAVPDPPDPLTIFHWELSGPSPDPGQTATGPFPPGPIFTIGPLGDLDGDYTLTATQDVFLDPTVGTTTVSFKLDRHVADVGVTPLPGNLSNPSPIIGLTNVEALATVTARFQHGLTSTPGVFNGSTVTPTTVLPSGSNTLIVFQTDQAGNVQAIPTQYAFTVDGVAPTGVIAHVPTGGAIPGFTRNTSITIALTQAPPDTIDGVTPSGEPITYALSTGVNLPGPFSPWTTTNRTIGVTPVDGAITTVSLWARDAVGNTSLALSAVSVKYDKTPPTVAGTSFPLPGVNLTTAFGPLANVQINFSEPVQNPVSLIRVCANPCGPPIAAAVTYSEITGPTAILDPLPATPTAGLAVGTMYEIELPAVLDRAGNLLAGPGNTAWTFTTSTDGTPPGLVTNLTAVPGIGRIALSWTRPPDADLARITVLRGTTPPASAADATAARFSLAATATSFTDLGLTPGVTYHYAVYAEDAVGNPSGLVRSSAVPKFPLVLHPKPPNTISARSMRPKKGKVLGTLRPLMRWKATRRAPFYNLQIVDLSTNKKVVSVFPRAPRYRVAKNRLKAGHRYAWRVWSHRPGPGWFSVKRPMTSWFDVSPKAKK